MIGGTIRQAIQSIVRNDGTMKAMLADYSGEPAFFYSKSPLDSRPGWTGAKYPRVDFVVDMRQDPERKSAGSLWINVFVTSQCIPIGDVDPERAIEERLIELLSGTFYSDNESGTFCTEWERSDSVLWETQNGETHPEVYGLRTRFEIMEFPPQLTTDPDPIQGLNRWIKKRFPEMAAIAYDNLPEVFRPTDTTPAIYWRFSGNLTTDRQSYAVTWYNGTFYGHILAESVMERNRWIKAITETMQLAGEVILPDDSPMFIKQINIRHGADPLREGQIELTGQYGVLAQHRKERAGYKLMHPYVNKGIKEEFTWKK